MGVVVRMPSRPPVWQSLRNQIHDRGVEIVTVALDAGGVDAARPWIEAAKPEHPSLIDGAHSLDELLGVVNVPNSESICVIGSATSARVARRTTTPSCRLEELIVSVETESDARPPDLTSHCCQVVNKISPRLFFFTTLRGDLRDRSEGAVLGSGNHQIAVGISQPNLVVLRERVGQWTIGDRGFRCGYPCHQGREVVRLEPQN